MKNHSVLKRLISSVIAAIILLYFTIKTTGSKIIFIPFLICSLALAGKSLAQLLHHDKAAAVLQKGFIIGLLLFWGGFLVVSAYIGIRDKNNLLLIFSIPFWIIGILLLRHKIFNRTANSSKSLYDFRVLISALLILLALTAGIALLIIGFIRTEIGLVFAGALFSLCSFAFVLAALTVKGRFDRFRISVLGLYIGIVSVLIGSGITMYFLICQSFGFLVVIPILMALGGALQIIKCIRNRQ